MEVNQDVGVVAVDLLESELGIPGPEVEGPAQLQPDSASVQAAGLLGSQATTRRSPRVRNRLIDPTIARHAGGHAATSTLGMFARAIRSPAPINALSKLRLIDCGLVRPSVCQLPISTGTRDRAAKESKGLGHAILPDRLSEGRNFPSSGLADYGRQVNGPSLFPCQSL